MIEFTGKPKCPKCTNKVPLGQYSYDKDALVMQCLACGFTFNMKAADTKAEPNFVSRELVQDWGQRISDACRSVGTARLNQREHSALGEIIWLAMKMK